jgi:sterol desaturase/sphingolipid hydroxylase (fatty acid hydroxylase superfamily)
MASVNSRPKLPGLSSGGSIRLFKNPILEALTHVHPLVPLLLWGPVVLLLLVQARRDFLSIAVISGLVFLGFVSWTLTEYLLHRFVFHFKPKGPFQERIEYLIHGIHHDAPEDATRLVMPPAAAVLLASLLYFGFRLLMGPLWISGFFAGFLLGYLAYDYIHYAIHHFAMSSPLGKYLKNHHMKHHFMTHGARWGVSSPLWDYIFGTMKERRQARSSA